MNRTLNVSIAVCLGLIYTWPALGSIAMPFEHGAVRAPFVLLVRYEEGDVPQLRVLSAYKGSPEVESITLDRPEWLHRPLESGKEYLILLASDLRPFVGRLTPDEDPKDRIPVIACGAVNVLPIVDGYVHNFYTFVKGPKGQKVTTDEYVGGLDLHAEVAG